MHRKTKAALGAVLLTVQCFCTAGYPQPAFANMHHLPHRMLWAWERNEDLSYINPREYGVAYLACHAFVEGKQVKTRWRDQYLKVPASTKMVPVIRVDVEAGSKPALSPDQIVTLCELVLKIASKRNVTAVQIDFDARQSERKFYTDLLQSVRAKLPREVALSITALASWCLFDDWIKDLPVDETVPMMFSLGSERDKMLLYFHSHDRFLDTRCCESLGVSLEDSEVNALMIPTIKNRNISTRIYVFTRTPWTADKLRAVETMLGKR